MVENCIRMTKKQLLDNLRNHSYCRIGISKISGVGVLALRNIPKDIDPFKQIVTRPADFISVTEKELSTMPQGVQRIVKDFFMKFSLDGTYPVYCEGLNAMDITFYLNHSDTPNVAMVLGNTKQQYYVYRTIKDINEGDELTIDYYQNVTDPATRKAVQEQFGLPDSSSPGTASSVV
jgi:hypothetical protein